MSKNRQNQRSLSHLPSHFGLFLVKLIASLPLPLLRLTANFLGSLFFALAPYRRKVAHINMSICFPKIPGKKINGMARSSFCDCVMGFFWGVKVFFAPTSSHKKRNPARDLSSGSPGKFVRKTIWEGDEKLAELLAKPQRVVLLAGHSAFIDITGWVISRRFPSFICTYKKLKNPVFNKLSLARAKYMKAAIESDDIYRIKSSFTKGDLLWIAVDQDIARPAAVYSPFFDIPASSPITGWRWTKIMRAEAFLLHSILLPDYTLKICFRHLPEFGNLPAQEAINLQNNVLTEHIKMAPTQYLWAHRRFKNRPAGESSFYPPGRP